jgi:holo-[acyl-carrier protein] synthase
MIVGLGVDIVEIQRINKLLERYGDRFANRLLTRREFKQFEYRKNSATFLASRFAAKEAASKALGTGIARGVNFHSFEIVNDEQGKPQLLLHDQAWDLSQQLNISNSLVSLSDEKQYAVAMVVMESA